MNQPFEIPSGVMDYRVLVIDDGLRLAVVVRVTIRTEESTVSLSPVCWRVGGGRLGFMMRAGRDKEPSDADYQYWWDGSDCVEGAVMKSPLGCWPQPPEGHWSFTGWLTVEEK